MSRFAIGYSSSEIDRPIAVFVETPTGVLVQRRGEAAVQALDRPFALSEEDPAMGEVRPGDPVYFDVVLDAFATSVFIRTVTDFEPDVFASMLLAEDNWDLLPRPHVGQVAA